LKNRYIVFALIFLVIISTSVGTFILTRRKTETSPKVEEGLLPEITNCTVITGVRYSTDFSPSHLLDVYLPGGSGPFPAIIYIHGGGWAGGSRAGYNDTASFYAKRGIAGFAIDYTLSTQNKTAWPDNAQDVIEAIRFIRGNALNYRIDSDKMALFGYSSGAQFASLAGTLSGNESFLAGSSGDEQIRSHVSLVVDYSGATDFDFIGKYENTAPIYYILANALGNVSYRANASLWKEASAATYISSDDPIYFIVHGTNDTVVPIAVSESFNSKLQAAGVETHFIKVEGGDHDILTSESENLIVRYSLEPLLKRVFNLDEQLVPEFPAPNLFSLTLIFILIGSAVFLVKYSRKCSFK
jgi:acetyl esterase/lipase